MFSFCDPGCEEGTVGKQLSHDERRPLWVMSFDYLHSLVRFALLELLIAFLGIEYKVPNRDIYAGCKAMGETAIRDKSKQNTKEEP